MGWAVCSAASTLKYSLIARSLTAARNIEESYAEAPTWDKTQLWIATCLFFPARRTGRLEDLLLGCRLSLRGTLPGENVRHGVVPLVAGVLVHRKIRAAQRNQGGPRAGPRIRIDHRVLVLQRVGIEARQAFDQLHVAGGPSPPPLFLGIGRFDHQRIALPVSSRLPRPLMDAVV